MKCITILFESTWSNFRMSPVVSIFGAVLENGVVYAKVCLSVHLRNLHSTRSCRHGNSRAGIVIHWTDPPVGYVRLN